MPVILFTTPILEHPAAGGPQLRIENSIKALNIVSDLHVVSRASADEVGDVSHFKSICKSFCFAPSATSFWRTKSLICRVARKCLNFATGKSILERDSVFIVSEAKRLGADIIWFGYGNISFDLIKLVRRLWPQGKLVCDTDSVWSRFVLRALDVVEDQESRMEITARGKAKELEEKESVALCDVITAVSEIDKEYYDRISSEPDKVFIFSNVIDLNSYAIMPHSAVTSPAIFLGGSYGDINSPMGYAANWFVKRVMPLVWQAVPDAHVYLVGRDGEVACSSLVDERVTATGIVPTVLPYLCHSACSVVPLFFESGTRFKILESSACGIPVVSTTLGAEGIPVEHGKHCLIADTAEDFANSIISLIAYPDTAKDMARRCKELVCNHYSVFSLAKEAQKIIYHLVR